MLVPYEEPSFNKPAFNCPFCNAYADFLWKAVQVSVENGFTGLDFRTARCTHCRRWTLWTAHSRTTRSLIADTTIEEGDLIYPRKLTSPPPHKDLPESCKAEYEEARQVLQFSPRAAAALLRLNVQRLCKELGAKGDNINADIGALVNKGLDSRVQKALDIVRITGNNAVHPGVMESTDDKSTVEKLFKLVNLIVEEMITNPNEIDELYGELPEGARQGIEKRDGSGTPSKATK